MIKKATHSVRFGAILSLALAALAVTSSIQSCATLNALAGLSRIQFKLGNVSQIRLAGIDITNKHSLSDFNVLDGVNLLSAFNSGKFPLTFTLGLDAKNPNQPSGSLSAIQVSNLPWRLLIDDHETISGNIGSPVSIPNGGTTETIPLQVSVDLKQFFGNKGYNDLLNLAIALSGQGGASHLQLKTQPTMSTPIGSMRYPTEITVVNTEFRS